MHCRSKHLRYFLFALLSLSFSFAACTDDDGATDPLAGTYQITSHTLTQSGSCDVTEDVSDRSTCTGCIVQTDYLKFKIQSFFGQTMPTVIACTTADQCADDGEDPNTITLGGAVFEKKSGDTWIGSGHAAGGSGTSCTYTRTDWSAAPTDSDGINLTKTVKSSVLVVKDFEECSAYTENPPAEDTLTCLSIETIQGASTP